MNLLANYYEQHREELVAYATKALVSDRMTAEDIVQNTFLRLLGNGQIITPVTLPSLVYTSLRHQLCDLFRQRQSRMAHDKRYEAIYATDCTESVTFRIEARQLIGMIGHRIDRMDGHTAQVLRLSIMEQRPVSEIAEVLSLKYKTAENLLYQGRKVLRPYVQQLMA
jgi:RNA polymerase sigma-70 factor (ECF subfamily)